MERYWVLEVFAPGGKQRATIGEQPDMSALPETGLISWTSGYKIQVKMPEPMTFRLNPDAGNFITDFFPPVIPLMSKKFLDALNMAGADNIDAYEAILLDKDGQRINEKFQAVNIIGRIAAADLEQSICEVDDPDDPVGVDFESLVIDTDKARGAKLFRLHEAVNAIIVHDSVKKLIEKQEFRGIKFVEPENWIG